MTTGRKDIENREDIERLIQSFYTKVNADELLSPIFNQVAAVHWETHLPVMYDFWNSILFGEMSYKGNPFAKHISLPIHQAHFERWLHLFTVTVDELFEGKMAEEAKQRASGIAGIFQYKLEHIRR